MTAIYARTSRASESAFGSCQAQEVICRDTANALGWEIKEVFADDGGSSETLDRPELNRLIDQIELGIIRRLIVDRADRLSRRLAVTAELMKFIEEHRVELIVVTDPNFGQSAAGTLASNIVAAASEFQLDMTRERMADTRTALKSHGQRVAGPVPFCYRADPNTKQLVQDAEEAVVVRDIFKLASDGARPSEIASMANLQNWPNRKGETGKWSSGRIRDLLKNPIYAGEIRSGDSTLPGAHQAIVTRGAFDNVQFQMAERRTQMNTTRSDFQTANLRGRVICGGCDRPMSTSASVRRIDSQAEVRYRYYRCRSESGGRPPCPGVSVSVSDLEQALCRSLAGDSDAASEIPAQFQEHWVSMDDREQLASLSKVIDRVVYNHDRGSVEITFSENAIELGEAAEESDR